MWTENVYTEGATRYALSFKEVSTEQARWETLNADIVYDSLRGCVERRAAETSTGAKLSLDGTQWPPLYAQFVVIQAVV